MTASQVHGNNITNIVAGDVNDKVNLIQKVIIDEKAILTTSIDEVGDSILFGPVPSNARILDIEVVCDDLDSNGAPTLDLNFGLYYMGDSDGQKKAKKDLGDVVDADCFAADSAIGTAAVTSWTSVRFATANITTVDKEAWEIGGLTEDCGGHLAIGVTVGTNAAATAAAGDMALRITYI